MSDDSLLHLSVQVAKQVCLLSSRAGLTSISSPPPPVPVSSPDPVSISPESPPEVEPLSVPPVELPESVPDVLSSGVAGLEVPEPEDAWPPVF